MQSISDIKKNLAKTRAMKKEIEELRALLIDEYISMEEEDVIKSEIIRIENELSKYKIKQVLPIDQDFLTKLSKTRIEADDLDDKDLVYLYEKFLVKGEISLIAAKPSGGKSITTMALSNMALLKNDVTYVFYFDLDNSPTTLKKRGIDKLEQKWGDRFQYHSPIRKKNGRVVKKEDIWNVITELKKRDLNNVLIVFDSAKNFLKSGADRDKNKDVSPLMEFFKQFRDLGATIILLHHTNKPNKDLDELTYAGSSAWEEDSSNAFLLKNNEYRRTFIFIPFKKRVGELEEIAFEYKEETHSLNKVELEWAREDEVDEAIRDEIIDFIKTSNQKPNYSQIMKYLNEQGYTNKDKANAVIQNNKNKYWRTTKIPEKNFRDVYELIKYETLETKIEIVYEDNSQISKISHINSDKSYSRDTKGKEVLSDKSSIYLDRSQNMNIDMPTIL